MTSAGIASVSDDRIVAFGRMCFGAGLIGIGVQHLFFSQFIPVVVPLWPSWIPEQQLCVYAVGSLLIVAGGFIVSGSKALSVAFALGVLFFLSVVLLHIPARIMGGSFRLGGWTNAFKALTLSGGAFVVAVNLPDVVPGGGGISSAPIRVLGKLIPLGMYPLAITVIVFGVDHFLYTDFVASLVPEWIPGHVFWTYFAGAALVASGVGMIARIKARLASSLLGATIFTWLIILHIPRAFADLYGGIGNEWTSVFEALAFSGMAFILGRTLDKHAGKSSTQS